MGLLIQNGTVIGSGGTLRADVLTEGSVIRRIAPSIPLPADGLTETVDAGGLFVIPGGIDPHVHMHLRTASGYSSDTFASGSRAALMGGTTTIIDFVTPGRGQSLKEAIAQRQEEASECMTGYSFHVSPVEWGPGTAEEIRECVRLGLPSFKAYMAYKDAIGIDDAVLEKVMREAASSGGMVTVHCETGDEVDALRTSLAEQGHTGPLAHAISRPPRTESDAVEKAIQLAAKTACPLYIVHVSTAASVALIREAQKRGQRVCGEACTHHLLLDVSLYSKPFHQSAPFVLSPPLRTESDRKALWEGLRDGTLETTGSDHCPFFMAQKESGRDDFRKIANGAGGVEHRMELLYTHGVLTGRFSMEQFTALTATNAAKQFGMFPRKGVLAEGADADIVLWDPRTERTISSGNHHQNSDINIYEGFRTKGRPRVVILGGTVVVRDGRLTGINSTGKMIKRPAAVR